MRAWTKSACVVLAWSVLSIILVAAGMEKSAHPAQANTRTMSSTEVILTSMLSTAAASVTAASPSARYAVQYGDTLSSIAARFAERGGWPALYAANRKAIGPDPDVIHPGTVLVLPGQTAPVRYTVAAGDTLSGIAAEFAVRGGWRALYAANRMAIGADPNVIGAGTVLTVPRSAASSRSAPGRAFRRQQPPAPAAGPPYRRLPVRTGAPAAVGMPQWLQMMMLAVGVVILAAFLAGRVLAVRRRRQQAAGRAAQLGRVGVGPWRDGGGRFRGVTAAVRPVVAAARVHPAGVAVPGAVLAAGIVLFTFVESAIVRVVPPQGGCGPGSAHTPGTGQPHHCLQSRPPRLSGEPALPSSPGPPARSLTGSLEQVYPPLPTSAAVLPAGPGRAPRASPAPSSSLPVCGLVCDVKQVHSSAATAGGGGADR